MAQGLNSSKNYIKKPLNQRFASNASTNSKLLNGLKSLRPSPAPINLIGRLASEETAKATPPRDVPSSFVITTPVKEAA